ncbi:hypothetical protein GCM10020001_095330 [Nonomuraea salmonea]
MLVAVPEVAGGERAAGAERQPARHDHPSHLPGRQLAARWVLDADGGAAWRAADGAGRGAQVGGGGQGGPAGLGGAVQVVEDVAVGVHEAGGEVGGQGGAAGDDDPQAGQRPGRKVEQAAQHHRYGDQRARAGTVERVEDGRRVEAAQQHDGAAEDERGGVPEQAEPVEQRRRDQHRLAAAQRHGTQHRDERLGHRPPWTAAAAPPWGVPVVPDVSSTSRPGRFGHGGASSVPADAPNPARPSAAFPAWARSSRSVMWGAVELDLRRPGRGEEHVHALPPQHLTQPGAGQAGVEEQQVGPEPGHRRDGGGEAAVVGPHDGHRGAGPDAEPPVQAGRQRGGVVVELGERDAACLVDHGRPIGPAGRGDGQAGGGG